MSFFSITQLIDAIKNSPEKENDLISFAVSQADRLIYTPNLLQKHIAPAMATNKRLASLIDISRHSSYHPDYQGFCSELYGPLFLDIERSIYKVSEKEIVDHGDGVNTLNIPTFVQTELNDITHCESIHKNSGKPCLKNYDIEIQNSQGYAEWWDRSLLNGQRDKLVIKINQDSMYKNDLIYTLYHEVYPGHGHFYNRLAHNPVCGFDHGAISLIEGWATYCEWNTLPSAYISSIKNNALLLLKESFSHTGDDRADKIYNLKRALGYSAEESLRTVLYTSQYIGYLEDYYLGALWIESYLKHRDKTPYEFLEMLANKTVGEFYKIWQMTY